MPGEIARDVLKANEYTLKEYCYIQETEIGLVKDWQS
jgi:hypothetical protein